MSNNIKGITIEIGGDTQGLNTALKDVNKQSKDLQNELKAVERALKFDPGNVELVRQKQELLTASIQSTSEKLDVLKTAQAQVEAQFQRGEIGVEQYRTFQRELQSTENEMRRLQSQLSSLDVDQDRLAQTTRQLGTFFEATNTDVEQFASTLGTRLTQAIRDGSATADQMERALRLMGSEALGASTDIDQMREALRNADNGSSLDEIRADLQRISQTADEAEESVKGFGSELGAAVGGLAAGGGIAGAVTAAIGDADLKAVIDVTFDVPEESKSSVLDAVRGVQAYGVDAEQALEGVRRQWALNGDASDESNAKVVKHAGVISKAYADIDFQELIQEANEIGGVLEISTEEALAMTNALLKAGFDPNQLDIISEYGNQLKMAGFNAQEIQAIMASGVDTKTWNIDNLLDGIKEGRIVGAEFGAEIDDATKTIIGSAGLSATKFQELGKAIASGGEEGGAAMQELAKMLASVEDDTIRNQLGTKMYGTLWEEQGTKIVDTLMNMDDHMMTSAENTKLMDEAVKGIDASPLVQIQQAAQDVTTALGPVFEKIAEVVAKIAEWVSNNAGLAALLATISVALGVFTGAFAALMPAIGALVSLWPALVSGIASVGAPVLIAIAAIVGLGAAFIALWQESETFRTNLTAVFEAIKSTAETVFEAISSFIGEKITAIKSFWETEGEQILAAAKNIFEGIMAVVEFVMPAIQLIIDVVWGAIKNIITGALDIIMGALKVFSGLFTGDFEKMWEGVKQLFKGAIDVIVGWMSLTFVGGIRALITNFTKTIISAFTSKWTSIVNLFKSGGTGAINAVKSMVTSVTSFVKNLATNFVSTISTMKKNVVNKVVEIKDGIVGKIKEINLLQIGKDIIQGLINGIASMSTLVTDKVKEIANSIPEWAKKMLGIKSPSRVMMGLGKHTGEGLALGLAGTKKTNQTAMKEIGDILIKETKNHSLEIQKIDDDNEKQRAKIKADYAKKISKVKKSDNKKIVELEKEMHAKLIETNDKAYEKMQKKEAEVSANRLEVINKFMGSKKAANELSLIEEAQYWRTAYQQFKNGTEENLALRQSYQENVQRIGDAINTVNTNHLTQAQKINDDLIKGEQDLNQKYSDALENRYKTILNYYGLFDAVTKGETVDKSVLSNNLQDQVSSLKDWSGQIEQLKRRNISKPLLEELQDMGVKATEQLRAMNSMSDVELRAYQNLYQEKARLAKEQAIKELEPLKTETQNQIQQLRNAANIELDKLNADWQKAIENVVGQTDTKLKTLNQVGKDAGQGLLEGLSSMQDPLAKKAKEMANSISKTIKGALQIKSPSRVMKGFGLNIGAGLVVGMDDMISKVSASSERLSNAVVNAQGSLASSTGKSQANQVAHQQIINQSNNIDLSSLVAAIVDLANRPVQPQLIVDGREVTTIVSSHQYHNTNLAALTKGVSFK